MLSIFSTVDFMANLDWSIPIQGRSNECADFNVVPEPQNNLKQYFPCLTMF